MTYFLTITLKVLAWASLLGSTAVFFFSVASARISTVLGAIAFAMGFVAFAALLALGILLERSAPPEASLAPSSRDGGDVEDARSASLTPR